MLWINRLFCHHQLLCLSQCALQPGAQTLSQPGHGAWQFTASLGRLWYWKTTTELSLCLKGTHGLSHCESVCTALRDQSGSKPFAFIRRIKNKQGLSFLSFHSADAHSPPRLPRHPAGIQGLEQQTGIKAGVRDGGAEMQHHGELRAPTHPAGLRASCSIPARAKAHTDVPSIPTLDIPAV